MSDPSALERLHPRVAEVLLTLETPFEVVACDETLADTAQFCAHYGYSIEQSANTIVVVGKVSGERRHVACLLLATCRLDVNRVVRKRMGVRRISFASGEDTRALSGMELGGITPLALPHSLPLWIDQRVMTLDRIILGGGNRCSKLIMPPQPLMRLGNAEVIDGLARPIDDPTSAS